MPITEALMTVTTYIHIGNIQQYNKFTNFLKQYKFGVPVSALDDYKIFVIAFTLLPRGSEPLYNKLKSRSFKFPENLKTNLMNFNKPNEHGHKTKPMDSYKNE